ncbi:MAG: hypothetical protein ACTS9Y_10025 [Methylophilus sp.]|uniref:hypothetical protein n=1 Tax=Methylophilus sp. TaxID=29541 RepID=UPI003FA0C3FD
MTMGVYLMHGQTQKKVVKLVVGLLWLACMQGANAADGHFQPGAESYTREADYTLGSIARQHIKLHVPPGFELDPASLPAPAQNEAIELREAHWTNTNNKTERLIQLDIDWQIFVAGDTVKTLPLKSLHLQFKRDQQRLTIDVPADKVIVSSLLPARIDAEHVKLYPDAPLPEWPLSAQLWKLAGWLFLLGSGLVYMAWYMGWIQFPQEKRMPFRQAWRGIRKFKQDQNQARMEAMRLMSRALDQFAGYAVTAENLPRLLASQSALTPYREALQHFYQEVQHTFFAGQPVALSLNELTQLAKNLSHMEVS